MIERQSEGRSVRAVVFDVGGVLALVEPMDFDRRWEQRLGLPTGTIEATMADVWAAGGIGGVTEAAVHEAMCQRLGWDAGQVEAVMSDMWQQYLGVANTGLMEYARTLRPAHRTGILSNSFVGAREREEQRYAFSGLVDDIIYSHEAGLSKPDPALWQLTCRRMNAEPDEIVFVDNVPALVDGARAFGMRAVLFGDTAQAIADIDAHLR
ncbi:HAD family phosphatase [Actinoplanes sp. DH11]|uniref:HAD family hydrolase n=1 Tax=Actinoplanes sp. DH11 TaxID=2857011 RepID=UPI001E3D789A|nr:HAD family phosphatase [Actinoplanes sp. DH11]